MNTSLFCTLQTWISEAMLEAEGGWGKYPKQGTRAQEREIYVRKKGKYTCARKGNIRARREIYVREKGETRARIKGAAEKLALQTNINQ